jgi:hypothetical protein
MLLFVHSFDTVFYRSHMSNTFTIVYFNFYLLNEFYDYCETFLVLFYIFLRVLVGSCGLQKHW